MLSFYLPKINYTLTAKDPKQRGLKASLGGSLESGSLQPGSLQSRESRVWESTGLGQPILDLGTHSLDWESTVWGSRVWGSTGLGQPILDLGTHLPVLKKKYRGPFNVNVV